MAAGEMKVLMEVGKFDMDGGVDLAMIHVYIDIQKCDFVGGGVPGELDGIAAVTLPLQLMKATVLAESSILCSFLLSSVHSSDVYT